jgi:hypothetical protein
LLDASSHPEVLLGTLTRSDLSLKGWQQHAQKIPLAPLVCDLVPRYAVDFDARIFPHLVARRYASNLAPMDEPHRKPGHNLVALDDLVLDGEVCDGEGAIDSAAERLYPSRLEP